MPSSAPGMRAVASRAPEIVRPPLISARSTMLPANAPAAWPMIAPNGPNTEPSAAPAA